MTLVVQEKAVYGVHASSRTHSPQTVGGVMTSQPGGRGLAGAAAEPAGRHGNSVVTSSEAVTCLHDSVQTTKLELGIAETVRVCESNVRLEQCCIESCTETEDPGDVVDPDYVPTRYEDTSPAAEMPDSESVVSNRPQSDISSIDDDDDVDDDDYEDDDVIIISSSSSDE